MHKLRIKPNMWRHIHIVLVFLALLACVSCGTSAGRKPSGEFMPDLEPARPVDFNRPGGIRGTPPGMYNPLDAGDDW